jgi:hypothetical protein
MLNDVAPVTDCCLVSAKTSQWLFQLTTSIVSATSSHFCFISKQNALQMLVDKLAIPKILVYRLNNISVPKYLSQENRLKVFYVCIVIFAYCNK